MSREILYGLDIGYPETQVREETLGKLESLGWFTTHGDWGLKSIRGFLVKLTPSEYKNLARDPDFSSVPYPGEDIVVLELKIPETEEERTIQRGTDINISLQ